MDKVGVSPDIVVTEEEFTETELDSIKKIYEEDMIFNFIEENPESNEKKISAFIKKLNNEGIVLRENVLRKLIRNEYSRKMDFPPVYDLEYDTGLRTAIKHLNSK